MVDDASTTLYTACFEGHLDVVLALLKSGSDPNELDRDGERNALHACRLPWTERLDIARALLNAGADVNARTKVGSPLHCLLHCFAPPHPEDTSSSTAKMSRTARRDSASWHVTSRVHCFASLNVAR